LRNCKTPEHTFVCEDFYNERNAENKLQAERRGKIYFDYTEAQRLL